MEFRIEPEEAKFRGEIREFMAGSFPELAGRSEIRSARANRAEIRRWTRLLADKGWLVPHWPKVAGDAWPPERVRILREELGALTALELDRVALDLVGPLLCAFGSAEQREHYLPRILQGEDCWCQGFSEPQAGSDVFALATIADRRAGHYVVSGHKVWTTQAHDADMMLALVKVRTGQRVQQGLTFLLIDMHAPGITVRPIATVDGLHHLNEVFIREVRVPEAALVGQEGKGWIYARAVLATERASAALFAETAQDARVLRRTAALTQRNGVPLIEDPVYANKVVTLEIELRALEYLVRRISHADAADPDVDSLAPIAKLRGSELRQRVSELLFEGAGYPALAWGSIRDPITTELLFRRAATIAAGTSETQRNVISAFALGL